MIGCRVDRGVTSDTKRLEEELTESLTQFYEELPAESLVEKQLRYTALDRYHNNRVLRVFEEVCRNRLSCTDRT